jgi:hypothetical protein
VNHEIDNNHFERHKKGNHKWVDSWNLLGSGIMDNEHSRMDLRDGIMDIKIIIFLVCLIGFALGVIISMFHNTQEADK